MYIFIFEDLKVTKNTKFVHRGRGEGREERRREGRGEGRGGIRGVVTTTLRGKVTPLKASFNL